MVLHANWHVFRHFAGVSCYFLLGLAVPVLAVWLSLGIYTLLVGAGIIFLFFFWDTLLVLAASALFWLFSRNNDATETKRKPGKVTYLNLAGFVIGVGVGAVSFFDIWLR